MPLVTHPPIALEMEGRALTNRFTTSFTPAGSGADLLRSSSPYSVRIVLADAHQGAASTAHTSVCRPWSSYAVVLPEASTSTVTCPVV